MGKFKGTKKPWRIDDDEPTFSALASDTYHQIKAAHGYHDDEVSAGFGIQGFMSIHDANLIAAAPELLEALQQCIPHLREQSKNDGHAFGTLQLVNRIIAKALGE